MTQPTRVYNNFQLSYSVFDKTNVFLIALFPWIDSGDLFVDLSWCAECSCLSEQFSQDG